MKTKTLDLMLIKYLNLFEKICKVRTNHCFKYNLCVIFTVEKNQLYKAIGENGKNIKKLSSLIGKKVKVVKVPSGIKDLREFISAIIYPLKIDDININERKIIVTAGRQVKAALIGRNKCRLNEMNNILKEYFGMEFKVI